MDRTDIGNCIIAGMAEGGTCLEQMAEIVTRLELCGWVIVPKVITEDIAAAMECEFSTEAQWSAALAAATRS